MRFAGFRAGLVWLILSFAGACGKPDTREFRDFERMRRQKRYDAYDVSAFFANGGTMQTPPESTVAIEAVSASAPPSSAPELLAIGRRQYGVSCAPCHGAAGFGGGLVAANLTERRPPALRSPHIASMTPANIFAIITYGKGIMPPLGWQLSPTLRWALVAYVQSMPSATSLPADSVRADSLMASYLQQIDSLHAAGDPIEAIARLQRPRS